MSVFANLVIFSVYECDPWDRFFLKEALLKVKYLTVYNEAPLPHTTVSCLFLMHITAEYQD